MRDFFELLLQGRYSPSTRRTRGDVVYDDWSRHKGRQYTNCQLAYITSAFLMAVKKALEGMEFLGELPSREFHESLELFHPKAPHDAV